jgi:hypothetical protein
LPPPHLLMATGLQPAMGNKLRNTLFRMCVLKHSNNATMCTGLQVPAVPIECFNTLPFSSHKSECHPVGRPFAHVLSAG